VQSSKSKGGIALVDLEKLISEKGEDWIIAALVYSSIGYYSPHAAKIHLDRLRNHSFDSNERVDACFAGNSSEELEFDFRNFSSWQEHHPDKATVLLDFVKKAKQVDDFAFNASFSAAAPTSGLLL
jgi:hypothetical protein